MTDDTRSAAEIERDLEATRARLTGTLDALSDKLDVKARATGWSRETARRAQASGKALVEQRGPELRIAGGAAAVIAIALLIRRATR